VLDQRVYPRFVCDLEVEIEHPNGRTKARAVDVSRGGICLSSEHVLTPTTEIRVALTLVLGPNAFSEPLQLSARVVWCTPQSDGNQIGCAFLPTPGEQAQYLEMFLRFLRGEGSQSDLESEDDPDAEPFAAMSQRRVR
jgi:hypothetical protein